MFFFQVALVVKTPRQREDLPRGNADALLHVHRNRAALAVKAVYRCSGTETLVPSLSALVAHRVLGRDGIQVHVCVVGAQLEKGPVRFLALALHLPRIGRRKQAPFCGAV
jgi:hypothetical protein